MFDAPLDAWYTWVALAAASVAVAGVALAIPTSVPPSPAPLADAVDDVASSPNDARTTVTLSADRLRLRPGSIALRSDGGTARATFVYGPVTPVSEAPLRRVLRGSHPATVFSTRSAFADRLAEARNEHSTWQSAPAQLTVRRVTWGDVDATLVG